MITNNDVLLSKLSYTDADFAELYPDLLDLAKQLTNKWDPSLSNESDPGVVLLKHAAFIGDHNNYNTDKNTLEAFLPTATQDISVRNIVEMNGYTPRYYVSASGRVSFVYKGDYEGTFVIPAFTIVVSNEDGTVAYTQVEDLSIKGKDIASTALFMEGTVQQLSINNASKVTMENINSDYRIYFPNSYVAQNGVFIKNVGDSVFNTWARDNYLLTQPKGEKRYKVDYDSSKGLPYIEFPSDIANLIGDGLIINYISTSGLAGNISARTLNTVQSPDKYVISTSGDEVSMSDFDIFNSSSIMNGKDPETINEMYNSFKKVVGTFNTLVTCLDYSNALYKAEDQYSNNILGNASVTDIRNDYNKAANLVTYDEYGVLYKNVALGEEILSAYKFTAISGATAGLLTLPTIDGKYTYWGVNSSDYTNLTKYIYEVVTTGGTSTGTWTPDIQTLSDVFILDKIPGMLIYTNLSGESNNDYYYYTYDGDWRTLNSLTELDFTSYTEGLSPYDLVIHALAAYQSNNYNTFDPYSALANSFKKPSDTVIKTAVNTITDLQCINHTFEYPSPTDGDKAYIFKNYAPIKCMITPYNKLSKLERLELKDVIYRTLSEKYNSHEVDWGEPINEEVLENDILNCDDRIRSVKLEPIEYVPTSAKLSTGPNSEIIFDEIALESDTDILTDLVAKNFLAGRICLFDFDDTFEHRYGQQISQPESGTGSLPTTITDITSATTEVKISQVPSEISGITKIKGIKWDENTEQYVSWDSGDSVSIQANTLYTFDNAGVGVAIGETNPTTNIASLNKKLVIKSDTAFSLSGSNITTISNSAKLELYFKDNDSNFEPVEADGSVSGTAYDYTLQDNEYLVIKHKNYYGTKSYSASVTYIFKSNTETTIPANTFYKLKAGESLQFIYTNSSDVLVEDKYEENTCIRSTFDIKDIDHFTGFKQKVTNSSGNKVECCSVPSGSRISICEPLTTVINNNSVKCYWLLNTDGNILFKDGATIRDLEQDEYFIYATKSESQMVIFGSGTRIERGSPDDGYDWTCDKSSISSITSNGFKADIDWKEYNFVEYPLNISEFEITTLGPGSKFTLDKMPIISTDALAVTLGNNWLTYTGSINYETEDGQTTLKPGTDPYFLRTRLDISTSENAPQKLLKTVSSGNRSSGNQKIQFISSNNTYTLEPASENDPVYLQTNETLELAGGSNISLVNYDNLTVYNYSIVNPKYEYKDGSSWVESPKNIKSGTNGYQITIDNHKARCTLPFQYSVTQNGQEQDIKQYILPVYLTSNYNDGPNNITASISDLDSITKISSTSSEYVTLTKWGVHAGSETPWGSFNYTTKTVTISDTETTIVDKITILTKTGLNSQLQPSITTKLHQNSIYNLYLKVSGDTPSSSDICIQLNTGDMTADVEIDVSSLLITPGTDGISKVIIGDAYIWRIGEFNSSSSDSSYIIDDPGMYLLLVTRIDNSGIPVGSDDTNRNINILANLSLYLSWNAVTRSGSITALNPVVINGLNINLAQYTTMENVLARISDIVRHSSAPNTKIYYINKPDNDLAIEDDNILNLFDKNNVANPITIAQIDFEGHDSYIEVVKSMMKG